MTKQLVIDEKEYPSNNTPRKLARVDPEAVTGEAKSKKIVKGGTRLMPKKKSAESIFATFIAESLSDVGHYILYDVLIPAAKATIQDAISTGIERLLFGDRGGAPKGGRYSASGKTFISYDNAYHKQNKPNVINAKPMKARFDFTNILFQHGGEAADVLEQLCADLEEYDAVTVAHFYELAGVDGGDYTSNGWGWRDLSQAFCQPVRGGYEIVLPKPVQLD